MSLVQNSSADSGRHDFVTGSDVSGPIVFRQLDDDQRPAPTRGPHHRWGNGLLFDNLDINGNAINVQNRWTSGSGHGWAGANVVIWNSEANSFIVQSPPTAQTLARRLDRHDQRGQLPSDAPAAAPGYYDSHGTRVTTGGDAESVRSPGERRGRHPRVSLGRRQRQLDRSRRRGTRTRRPACTSVSLRDYLFGDIDNYTLDAGAARGRPADRSGVAGDDRRRVGGADRRVRSRDGDAERGVHDAAPARPPASGWSTAIWR